MDFLVILSMGVNAGSVSAMSKELIVITKVGGATASLRVGDMSFVIGRGSLKGGG